MFCLGVAASSEAEAHCIWLIAGHLSVPALVALNGFFVVAEFAKALLPEDECAGCGIGYLGLIETVTPFCLIHNFQYGLNEQRLQKKTDQVDREFLDGMLRVADTFRLRALAYVYSGLARTRGGFSGRVYERADGTFSQPLTGRPDSGNRGEEV